MSTTNTITLTLQRLEKKIDQLQKCVDSLNYAMKEDERRAAIKQWMEELTEEER